MQWFSPVIKYCWSQIPEIDKTVANLRPPETPDYFIHSVQTATNHYYVKNGSDLITNGA